MKCSLVIALMFLTGCGVKGDPQPPLRPPHLGRGQPTFKEAVKEVKPTKVEKHTKESDSDEQE